MFPERIDLDVGWLLDSAGESSLEPCVPDVLNVPADPIGLQGADDSPDKRLLWGAAASFHAPASGDVELELLVLHSMGPDVLESELGPLLDGDVHDLCLGEQLLMPLHYLL